MGSQHGIGDLPILKASLWGSVGQCGAVWCSVVQWGAVGGSGGQWGAVWGSGGQGGAVGQSGYYRVYLALCLKETYHMGITIVLWRGCFGVFIQIAKHTCTGMLLYSLGNCH